MPQLPQSRGGTAKGTSNPMPDSADEFLDRYRLGDDGYQSQLLLEAVGMAPRIVSNAMNGEQDRNEGGERISSGISISC